MNRYCFSLRVGGWHLFASCLIAAISAVVVFIVWYPSPYSTLSGGLTLFSVLVLVDVFIGPALTTLVANPVKPRAELFRDLSLIVFVQLVALAYGLHTIALARPVLLSFEIDRMRVVAAADIDPAKLNEAPEGFRDLSWTGPKLIAAVKSNNKDDMLKSVESALAGSDISTMPRSWREFASQREAAWKVARPVTVLLSRYPEAASDIRAVAASANTPVDQLRFLPVLSRHASWVALVSSPGAQIVGFLPLEGFF